MDVGAGETGRILTGLSSGVAYSVSIVALAHFPSTVVGPVISRRQGDVLCCQYNSVIRSSFLQVSLWC